ncbi:MULTISPECIES: SDR family NAD(P)-dependent oxidoreductase [unclassified Rhizobium]|uniref:SDR family NAD(P)-dependent oxidoreductase n=1 Tax=Rhizobium TaxID=379 RepID=UPI00084BE8E2|nr:MULTISPECIES: SDR family NAD(P)-dependent oxidoreductase [unclassified Rhizobium]OEC99503.1 3-oxoacyl-ACP reductase [Rhizobium sp. YK2]QYA14377.1 SDR family NAD(P)-dependent oxidoreductase [Rhizobium sp. AB2/73]UEQ79690.1 SDR family NAD(P)-dependent oxidoreductase [Rhizobium sp. AB2/73]
MDMSGKTVLITGSTDGVGRRVAERLAAAGATVIVHGRDGTRAEELVSRIQDKGGKAAYYLADLSSLEEVRTLADAIERDIDRLDVLINNAGIGTSGGGAGRQVSQDGYELRFAVNYLAGFLLTHRLLPLLKASAPARIVNVSSVGQQAIDFSDVMLTRGYSGVRAYCQSKLAQIMFTFDLAEELAGSGITANCLHPATYMDTTMVRQAGVSPISSVEQGADAILNLAAGAALEGHSGLYYDGLRPSRASAQAYDATARQRLRTLSQSLSGLA